METRKQWDDDGITMSPGANNPGSSSASMISEDRILPNSTVSQVKEGMDPRNTTLAFQSDCADETCSKIGAEFYAFRARKITGFQRPSLSALDDSSEQERKETECCSCTRTNERAGSNGGNRRSLRLLGVCGCFSRNSISGNDNDDDKETASQLCGKNRDEQHDVKEPPDQKTKDGRSPQVVRKDTPSRGTTCDVTPMPQRHSRGIHSEIKNAKQNDLSAKDCELDDRKWTGSFQGHSLSTTSQPLLQPQVTSNCIADKKTARETEFCRCSIHLSGARKDSTSHSILVSSPQLRKKSGCSNTGSQLKVKRVSFREEREVIPIPDILSYTSSASALDTLDNGGCCGKS